MSERGGYDPNSESKLNSNRLPFDPVEKALRSQEKYQQAQRTRRIRQTIVGAIASIGALTGVGMATHAGEQSITPVDRTEQTGAERAPKPIEVEGLKPGDGVEYYDGVVVINTKELNARSGPGVIEDSSSGDSNKLDLGAESIVVSDPIIDSKDVNGTWAYATDSNGQKIYFNGDQVGTIEDLDKGGHVSLDFGKMATVKATTDRGNIAVDDSGQEHLVGTIVEVKK